MSDLVQVLERAKSPAAPERGLIVSNDFADDAAVVRLSPTDSELTVMTADVIAPIVDDAATFGRIAAANSISDVYAMGGAPRFALNLAFFPDGDLPGDVLSDIMAGAAEVCERAGVLIIGGHTVRDPELKFGLSVTGTVAENRVLSNRTARPGQALVLSKALGTGVLGTAIKKQVAADDHAAAAVLSMTTLNDGALADGHACGATACTDVTGFGLLGHLGNILRGSGLAARVDMGALPLLPGFRELVADGHVPGGSRKNLEFALPNLSHTGDRDDVLELAAADAQTSGGLLLCVPAENADALVDKLRARDLPAARIGELLDPTDARPVGAVELSY